MFLLDHLLSLAVIRCHSLYYFSSLVDTRYHSMYHSSVFLWTILSLLFYRAQKFTKFCLFIHFRWVDVKSSRCFNGPSLISIILWEYCENNIKTFWFYSYENKRVISRKVVRQIFFEINRGVSTNRIIFILIRIYVRIS